MKPAYATLAGLSALLMWSLLAVLTVATPRVPAFQLMAMTFGIGGVAGLVLLVVRHGNLKILRQPPRVWLIGIGGLFGYHALYFLALRLAPPAEAGLLNYLWPLLIVLLASPLLNMPLSPHHVAGAALGFLGTLILFGGGVSSELNSSALTGFTAAFLAAFVWASYSVLSRRMQAVPTEVVAGFCLVTALLAALCHAAFEITVTPQTTAQWLAVLALGIGPVGLAFYAWDIGMKRGDIKFLGAASYATPLLSTFFLVVAGYAKASGTLGMAALLIACGGLLAAKDTLLNKRNQPGDQPGGASSNPSN